MKTTNTETFKVNCLVDQQQIGSERIRIRNFKSIQEKHEKQKEKILKIKQQCFGNVLNASKYPNTQILIVLGGEEKENKAYLKNC